MDFAKVNSAFGKCHYQKIPKQRFMLCCEISGTSPAYGLMMVGGSGPGGVYDISESTLDGESFIAHTVRCSSTLRFKKQITVVIKLHKTLKFM